MTDHDDRQHVVLSRGRALSPHAARVWTAAFARYASGARRVIDVGTGTGRFAPLVADRLQAAVVGVDQSTKLLASAAAHPRVRYVAADACWLPLHAAQFDAALLSCVVHHLPDREGAALELARVLRPGGVALIRQSFSGRLDGAVHLRFFPNAYAIAERTMPTVEDTCAVFGRAGFDFTALESIHQETDPDPGSYADRIGLRANSLLEDITDEEFDRGLAELRQEVRHAPREPVVEWLDLLVLKKQ